MPYRVIVADVIVIVVVIKVAMLCYTRYSYALATGCIALVTRIVYHNHEFKVITF